MAAENRVRQASRGQMHWNFPSIYVFSRATYIYIYVYTYFITHTNTHKYKYAHLLFIRCSDAPHANWINKYLAVLGDTARVERTHGARD